jgi:hypothetical protein
MMIKHQVWKKQGVIIKFLQYLSDGPKVEPEYSLQTPCLSSAMLKWMSSEEASSMD